MDVLTNMIDNILKIVPKFLEFSEHFWTKVPKIFENTWTKMPNFQKIAGSNAPKFASKFRQLGPPKTSSSVN